MSDELKMAGVMEADLERKRWSLGFLFTSGLEYVMLLRKGKSLHIGLWNGVGGKVDKFEPYETSMVRECFEESGLQTQRTDWKRSAKLIGLDWSVGVFGMVGSDNRQGHPEYANMSLFKPNEFEVDKPIYVPVSSIPLLNLAPYTAALIHLCLEKLKNPEMNPVAIQTYRY